MAGPRSISAIFAALAVYSLSSCNTHMRTDLLSASQGAEVDTLSRHSRAMEEMSIQDMALWSGWIPGDCDANGYPDSLDILVGTADDLNENGVIDQCDDLHGLRPPAILDTWESLAERSDTSHFWTGHWWPDQDHPSGYIVIRYTVPHDGGFVCLVVVDSTGSPVDTLKAVHESSGAYEMYWDKTDSHQAEAPPGTYFVTLSVNGRTYERRVRWR